MSQAAEMSDPEIDSADQTEMIIRMLFSPPISSTDVLDPRPGSLRSDKLTFLVQQPTLFGDVTVVLRDGEIHTHRILLILRSQVFRLMFEQDMVARRNSAVTILDVSKRTFEQFLIFLGTDHVDITEQDAVELLHLAVMYMVPKLARQCYAYLASNAKLTRLMGRHSISRRH